MSDSYELLERVNDRDSLIAFVEAFIAERESAETLEREQPHRYAMGGALDWQNSHISSFLDGACQFLHHHVQDGDPPTWRMIAESITIMCTRLFDS